MLGMISIKAFYPGDVIDGGSIAMENADAGATDIATTKAIAGN